MRSAFSLLFFLFLLTGCNPQPESAVANPKAASETNAAEMAEAATDDTEPMPSAQDVPPEKQVQILTSSDKKIVIAVEDGHFAAVSDKKHIRPSHPTSQKTTLFQYDPNSNITLSVNASGAGMAQTDAAAYFNSLTQDLQKQPDWENVRTGIATNNRMNYQFSQQTKTQTLQGSCIAIYENSLYTVCAISPSASAEQLARVLQDVNLSK